MTDAYTMFQLVKLHWGCTEARVIRKDPSTENHAACCKKGSILALHSSCWLMLHSNHNCRISTTRRLHREKSIILAVTDRSRPLQGAIFDCLLHIHYRSYSGGDCKEAYKLRRV